MLRVMLSAVMICIALGLPGCAPRAARDAGGPVLALVNGLLIDGTGGEPVADGALVIQAGRIRAAGPRSRVAIPAGAQVIDAGGGAILPGFINAHVHFAFNEKNLEAWARGGVTTVRDEAITGSGSIPELMAWRDEAGKDPKHARLVSAGRMITVPGGYGSLYASTPEEARKKALEELDQGVDLIKVSLEDGYAGRSGLPKLTKEDLAAIVAAAHERGVLVSGHITQAAYLEQLVDAGVDDAGHLAYDEIPAATLERMVKQGTYLTPTFTVFRNYGAPVEACVQNLANFVKLGGQVALGNDYGGGPGEFELGIPMYEVEMMAQAGMTPMQIVVASTRNAARVSGLEEELGTLEPGKAADVLALNGNPLEDLDALKEIRVVIHGGTVIVPEGEG